MIYTLSGFDDNKIAKPNITLLNINCQWIIHNIKAPVNYVIIPFKGKINPRYSKVLKLYLQAKKEKEKEADKLYITVSNDEYIVYQLLIMANKYGRGRLASM